MAYSGLPLPYITYRMVLGKPSKFMGGRAISRADNVRPYRRCFRSGRGEKGREMPAVNLALTTFPRLFISFPPDSSIRALRNKLLRLVNR